MLIKLHPINPQPRLIKQIAECLLDGGVIIYPTDTMYGLGCDIFQNKAIQKIAQLKNVDPQKAQLSFICKDLSNLSEYTRSIDTPTFRMLKAHLPGPFTFILPASKLVPKLLQTKKSTVGLRVPDSIICQSILTELNHPILSASIPTIDEDIITDAELIYEIWGDKVDMVIDGGNSGLIPSTIIDCTSKDWEIIRQGLGVFMQED